MKRTEHHLRQRTLCTSKTTEQINLRTLILSIFILFAFQTIDAQENNTKEEYQAYTLGRHLKIMHLWHGFVVHSGELFATNLEHNFKNSKFTLGVLAIASFEGVEVWNETTQRYVKANYKEFSIYSSNRFNEVIL
ncbi:hypothetical protein [Polaribacter sp.]|uniref:hypothetical protein n=1 Tax=Polaribacter sp. TaxID=1920175 RepID=UPI003EF791FE